MEKNTYNIFDEKDLVFYNSDNGKIMSGGYTVDSILLQNGGSPLTSYFGGRDKTLEGTEEKEKEENTMPNKNTSPFENLAIPVGILFINQQSAKSDYEKKAYDDNNNYKKQCVINDDIYDKLFEFASARANPRTINKNKITKHQKVVNNKVPNKRTKKRKPI